MALSWACRGDAFAVAPSSLVSPPEVRLGASENPGSFRPGPRTVASIALAGLALGFRHRMHRLVARRFKDDTSDFGPEAPDFTTIESLLKQAVKSGKAQFTTTVQASRMVQVSIVMPKPELKTNSEAGANASSAKSGWSSADGLRSFPQKLNSELANGRLAVLSASVRDCSRRATGTKQVPVDEDVDDEEQGTVPLPSDDSFGWDPDQVEASSVFDPAKEPGACEPFGFFDPLGICVKGDTNRWIWLRASEIKHGRVAMLASIALPFQHYVRLPGFEKATAKFASQYKVVNSGENFLYAVIFWVSLLVLELGIWSQAETREPGNFGDPLGVGMYTPEMRTKELNNGRFAMICTVGILAAQYYSGKDAIQQLGLA